MTGLYHTNVCHDEGELDALVVCRVRRARRRRGDEGRKCLFGSDANAKRFPKMELWTHTPLPGPPIVHCYDLLTLYSTNGGPRVSDLCPLFFVDTVAFALAPLHHNEREQGT